MRVLGTMSIQQLIFDDLEETVLPASPLVDPTNAHVEAPQDPRFQVIKKMDTFITRAADVSIPFSRLWDSIHSIVVCSLTSTCSGRYA